MPADDIHPLDAKQPIPGPDESIYDMSRRIRREYKKAKGLGFKNMPSGPAERKKSVSIAGIKFIDLSDKEFEVIQAKINLLPYEKRVDTEKSWSRSLTQIFGNDIAEELCKPYPDKKTLAILSRDIPDRGVRINARKEET